MSELYIRPGLNDHKLIADVLAPPPVATLRRLRPPISRLVIDATTATQRTQHETFGRAAADAGVPLLVDPLTHLLQSEVDPASTWAQLPYAEQAAVTPADVDVRGVVESVVQHQLDVGATRIIAPYLYCTNVSDPAFTVSLRLLEQTVTYLHDERVRMGVTAVFAGQLQSFGRPGATVSGIGRYVSAVDDLDVETLGLCLSPLGAGSDSYQKLASMVRVATAAASARRASVIAWRQGVYGPLLTAAGLDGYECGIGLSEQTDVRSLQNARRPKAADAPPPAGGPNPGIYFAQLGRSLPVRAGRALLSNRQLSADLLCDDDSCCRDVETMINRRREHAVRSRAGFLAELRQQPRASWRLHHMAQLSATAIVIAQRANAVLADAKINLTLNSTNLAAVQQIASELSQAPIPRSA